jgi:hypothetical protein
VAAMHTQAVVDMRTSQVTVAASTRMAADTTTALDLGLAALAVAKVQAGIVAEYVAVACCTVAVVVLGDASETQVSWLGIDTEAAVPVTGLGNQEMLVAVKTTRKMNQSLPHSQEVEPAITNETTSYLALTVVVGWLSIVIAGLVL